MQRKQRRFVLVSSLDTVEYLHDRIAKKNASIAKSTIAWSSGVDANSFIFNMTGVVRAFCFFVGLSILA